MKVKETFKKMLTWFLLACNVFSIVPIPTVFAQESPSKGDVQDPVVQAGSFASDGDVQVTKTVTKTDTLGKYNVNFTVKGLPVTGSTVVEKPLYVVVVFDRSGSMLCDNGTSTRGSFGDSKAATINGQNLYCAYYDTVRLSKWNDAVNGAIDFSEALVAKDNTYISLITFASNATSGTDFSRDAFTESDFGYPNGGTNLNSALNNAATKLNSISGDVQKVVLVISDGEPSNKNTCITTANTMKTTNGITIYSVGYGVSEGSTAEQTLTSISSNSDTDTSYYVRAGEEDGAEDIASVLSSLVDQISKSAAGKNAVMKDTIGGQFAYVSSNVNGVFNTGQTVTYNIGTITEEGVSFNFDIEIDPTTPTGWYDTNNVADKGVVLTYIDANNQTREIVLTSSPKVYWVGQKYAYTINYYKDSISESNHLGTVSNSAEFGTLITADTTLYLPEGYKFVGTAPSMTIQVSGNNIDVVYVKETYNYTINYYKDSISESNHLGTVSDTALFGDKITADTTLYLPEGYKFVGTAPSMTIQVSGNNIDVVYVKETYNYTINYYKDSISESNHLGTVSDTALFGDKITADTTLYLPEGYKFVGTAPSMTIQVSGNNIDVVYVKETYNYTINYYKDSISESNHLGTVSDTALFGDKITADTTLYLPEGYKFVGTAPSMTIQVSGNNIDVVYVKETYNYTINYYKDSISESNHLGTVSDTALFGDKITADTTLYLPEGYKFVGTAPSMTIQVSGNNIDVVYVKETYNYTINYYKDSISESNHLGTVSDTALFGDKITADTTLYLPEGYKFVGTAPSMTIQVSGNNIDVVYVKETYNYTINYYKDSISESNHLGTVSDTALFGDKITADTTLYLPEGYKFVGTAPSMTIQVSGNNIDVVYVKETYNYTINYYKDSISESNHLGTVSDTALFGDKITADTTLYLPEGYKFVGTAPSMTIQVSGNNIDVVYVKETYNYTINYYKDSISESNHLGTVSDTALFGDKITADTTLYLPEGYKFVGTAPSMTIQVSGNNIDVVYVKETYNYTINYYKDSISESNHLGTVSDTALFGDKITADTTLYLPEGYKFVGTAPSMTIQVSGNNIDVVYVKETYNYTINYYKDSISESNHLGTVSDTALFGDKITADTTLYLPEGYKFVGTAPSMTIQVSGNNIDVVYVKETYNYTINYYKDSISESNHLGTVSDTALFGDKITADTTLYLPEGYKFVGTAPSMTIQVSGNNIDVVYVKETYNYTINYYKDSISESNHLGTVSDTALFGDKITADTTLYLPEGYKFVGTAPSMTIQVSGNNINVVYVKAEFDYIVEYYFDGVLDENLTESYVALYGDVITEYIDKAKENYILDINHPVNVPLVIDTQDNVIKVYYVFDEGSIIPPYTGSGEENNLWNMLFFLFSSALLMTFMKKTKEN